MKVQPRDSRSEGPGTLQWGAEYALLSSSGVTGKVAASISDRRGNGLGVGEGASRTNFHPDSECQLRGPASPASPHCRPPPLLMPRQNCLLCPRAHSPLLLSGFRGLADQENGSPVGPRALASRTPQRGFHSSQGGFSSLKVLTACPCPPPPGAFLPAFLPTLPPAVPDLLSPCLGGTRASPMPEGKATRSRGTLRRPRPVLLKPQRSSAPPPPLLPLRVLPRAPLLLVITRIFREPLPLALLMQGLHVQDLVKVPRAPRRKVQVPPRKPLPLRALTKILWPGRPGYWWSSCWRSTPRRSPSCTAP